MDNSNDVENSPSSFNYESHDLEFTGPKHSNYNMEGKLANDLMEGIASTVNFKKENEDHKLSTSVQFSHDRLPSQFGLKPLTRLKVVYFHDPELAVFEHGTAHAFRPFRAKLTHELLCSYGYYPQFLDSVHPRIITRIDLGQFHSDTYLEVLAIAQVTAGKAFSWSATRQDSLEKRKTLELEGEEAENGKEINHDHQSDTVNKDNELFSKFNLHLSPDSSPNSVFPGILDYCRMVATGSLGCAAHLCSGDTNLAINWYGGMSHARGSSAHFGCFVNDTVLAILALLHHFPKVLYINLSGVHCDAVEQAFYSTDRVLTISFHLKPGINENKFFPGTGDVADCGVDSGEGFSVNVPLDPGVDDVAFIPMFRSIVNKARVIFLPDCVVLQCGGGLLAGERDSLFNMTCRGYGDCVRLCRDFELPLLLLGGVGRNLANTSRLWAHITTVALGLEASLPSIVPVTMKEYREYFAPNYETLMPRVEVPRNILDPTLIPNLRRKIMNNLDKLKHKVPFV